MQYRMLDPADILVHRQPVVSGMGIDGPLSVREQNRAKYQEESIKVSKRVGLPLGRSAALGTCDMLPCGMVAERIAGLSNLTSSGRVTGRSAFGTGMMPQT
jgi:hypothetical protein